MEPTSIQKESFVERVVAAAFLPSPLLGFGVGGIWGFVAGLMNNSPFTEDAMFQYTPEHAKYLIPACVAVVGGGLSLEVTDYENVGIGERLLYFVSQATTQYASTYVAYRISYPIFKFLGSFLRN